MQLGGHRQPHFKGPTPKPQASKPKPQRNPKPHADDRVGCRGLRPGTLPHHRTCGFPHPAVGLSRVLPARTRGRWMVEHSDGLNALCVRPVVCQLGVVTVVVAPLCFVLLFIRAASVSIGSIGSFGPSLGLPFGSCRPQTLLWPLLTPQRLSAPGSPRLRVRSFRSRLWALHSAFSGSWASCLLAHSPQTLCLIAHLCSFGRTFAFHPFAPLPYGIDLAVRLRLAPQAPDGNLSSRQIGLLPGTRARNSFRSQPPRCLAAAE